ncbi:hypothetical protein E2C01_072647 [Portunus trituberculatus]|uniref:Reverse transcriptase domain-containing protein n=1 Tax=Portunus trituberculatus TaxID=210409 RepID=A0A5B7I7Q9_PORTR|nr:hypothetical protein [Portunus trituberculatus]
MERGDEEPSGESVAWRSSPKAVAHADNCTLSWAYKRGEAQNVLQAVNRQLQDIIAWGERWQVKFAPEKNQAMVVTCSQGEADHLRGRLRLRPDTIPLQDSIEILGVEVDSRLQFDRHLDKVARSASSKVNLLRRMKHLLHADGLLTLYKAQCPLPPQPAKVQRRTECLISGTTHHQQHHPHWQRQQQHRQPQQKQQQQQEEHQRHNLRDSLKHHR